VRKALSIIAAVAAGSLSVPAVASDLLWLDSQHTPFYSGDQPTGSSLLFSVNGVNVRASAWSLHDGNIYRASLGVWPQGLGVKNGSTDNSHTVDNSGYLDFILFQFDQVVELDMARFNTGWHNMNDTDATIGYDTSNLSFAAPPAWHGQSQALLSALDFYSSNAGSGGPNTSGNSGNSYRDINPNNYTGNLWIVGASFNNPDGSYKLDGFKLEKLTFKQTGGVPEPSTWAMLLVGFFGIGGALRSSRRRAAGPAALSAA
jgi:hypothetical protein